MKQTIVAVLLALMLLLAGCSGGVDSGQTTDVEQTETAGTDAEGGATSTDGTNAASTGTVNLYVSDEVNAIDQFEHLNVTITRVGFARAGDEVDEESESSANANTSVEANTTVTANATDTNVSASANASVETNASVTDDGSADSAESDEDGDTGGWVEYDVGKQTADLTELQGPQSTKFGSVSLEAGKYTKVFVYVSEVEGTLKTGETVNVKLPSNKLQLNKGFAIESGESVDFVYDITVVEAGKSGKYVLKPVITESGTGDEVDIEVVEPKQKNGEKGKDEANDESGLEATFVGDVTADGDATVRVMQDGTAVEGATVTANGETVGTTNEDGELTFSVPEGTEELEVTVTADDAEVELSQTLATSSGENGGEGDGNGEDANGLDEAVV
ncbi:protein of unknown function [Halogranum rubrum]|uniref:DUF4382 domain-containing protein n=1 Tax=Halogranum rubrum TaxID=553466 RepID=A0A1I4GDD8_9EURY|nr:DUF4382 domain-containing protein [Halogranum rubrum]SFL28054.1 protein of unknown function [Halogranum rubrum]